MSRPIKVGEQIILYGKIKKFDEDTGEYVYETDLTGWDIAAAARDEDVNGTIVGNFVAMPSPIDAYFLVLDTSAITTSEKIAVDVRFAPPGGLPGYSKTYIHMMEKSVTPP